MVDIPRSSRRGPTAKDLLKDWGTVAKLEDAQLDDLQEICRQLDEVVRAIVRFSGITKIHVQVASKIFDFRQTKLLFCSFCF